MIAISAYTASVMTTTIADVMVIYATLPFVAAAIGFLINGERVSARTLVASGLALIGIADDLPAGFRIGVDVEHGDRRCNADGLSRKFLTERERAGLAAGEPRR